MWLWEEQGGLLGPFSFLLLLLLLVTRSPFNACLLTGSLYLLLRLFSFEPLPSRRALQVLKPRDRVSAIAHRGGGHDAPENTLAAIRQVSAPDSSLAAWELGLLLIFPKVPQSSHDSPPSTPCVCQEDMEVALDPFEAWKASQLQIFIEHSKSLHSCFVPDTEHAVTNRAKRVPAFAKLALESRRQALSK